MRVGRAQEAAYIKPLSADIVQFADVCTDSFGAALRL